MLTNRENNAWRTTKVLNLQWIYQSLLDIITSGRIRILSEAVYAVLHVTS